jgi:site-specific recombinase XerD
VAEWLTAGRRWPPNGREVGELSVTELIQRYWTFAKGYYRKNGVPTKSLENIRLALRPLRKLYGRTLVKDFGPKSLQTLQQHLVKAGLSRGVINSRIGKMKQLFRWAVAEELAPPDALHALEAVRGLQKGRTEARETAPVRPVAAEQVDATLPHLLPVVAAMVQLQRLTGARPEEICILRPVDVDRTGEVWVYCPARHKTEHHGRDRQIFIGPKGQEILRPFLLRDADAYCFSPREAEAKRNADRREQRETPMKPSQAKRRPKKNRKRPPGDRYTTNSYRRAIHRACELAFPAPDDLAEEKLQEWRKQHQWSPNQLRHTAGTLIRHQFGLEGAQLILGHARADITQIYAQRDTS